VRERGIEQGERCMNQSGPSWPSDKGFEVSQPSDCCAAGVSLIIVYIV
jgi:hypothetical protein